MKRSASFLLLLILFVAALTFMIPPIASDSQFPHEAAPALVIGGLLFGASLFLSWWRAAEHWITAAFKLLAYLVLVWLAYERSFIH